MDSRAPLPAAVAIVAPPRWKPLRSAGAAVLLAALERGRRTRAGHQVLQGHRSLLASAGAACIDVTLGRLAWQQGHRLLGGVHGGGVTPGEWVRLRGDFVQEHLALAGAACNVVTPGNFA